MEKILNIYVLMAIGYMGYFIISFAYKLQNINTLADGLTSAKAFNLLNIKHLAGIFLFGIGFWLHRNDYDFLIINSGLSNVISNIFLFIILFAAGFVSMQSSKKSIGKLDNLSFARREDQLLYFSVRLPFLFIYELFFRGILLHSSLLYTNLAIAILINLSLYTLIHSFNSKKEIIGCIPFGIILCLSSYYTNSIWPAFFIHATLSLAHELTVFNNTKVKTQKS
ncbi:MAG: CPBP family intramembrane glutamic endopeptidase [Lutibacter sp.]